MILLVHDSVKGIYIAYLALTVLLAVTKVHYYITPYSAFVWIIFMVVLGTEGAIKTVRQKKGWWALMNGTLALGYLSVGIFFALMLFR